MAIIVVDFVVVVAITIVTSGVVVAADVKAFFFCYNKQTTLKVLETARELKKNKNSKMAF